MIRHLVTATLAALAVGGITPSAFAQAPVPAADFPTPEAAVSALVSAAGAQVEYIECPRVERIDFDDDGVKDQLCEYRSQIGVEHRQGSVVAFQSSGPTAWQLDAEYAYLSKPFTYKDRRCPREKGQFGTLQARGEPSLDCGYVRDVYVADIVRAVSAAYPRHARNIKTGRHGTNSAGFRSALFTCSMRYRNGRAYGHFVLKYRATCSSRSGDRFVYSSAVA